MHSQSTSVCISALERSRGVGYALRMKPSALASNITALRKHMKLTQGQFADVFQTDQPNVSKWESKGITPSGSVLSKMAERANVPVGDFIEKPWVPKGLGDRGAPLDRETVEIVALDLSLSMGPGTLIEDFIESEPIVLDLALVQSITRTPSDRLRLVKGIGDSMEPTLRTGDRVMIDINERQFSRINGIYWIDHYGAHGIKRLRSAGKGRILVISDNPHVQDFDVGTDELRIEGRVIWYAREM
jgi:transcriptional regulator with XRE-family HTH domain